MTTMESNDLEPDEKVRPTRSKKRKMDEEETDVQGNNYSKTNQKENRRAQVREAVKRFREKLQAVKKNSTSKAGETEKKKIEDKAKTTKRQAKRRRLMDEDTAARIREENRLSHIQHREEMDEEERVIIREENRIRNIKHREEMDEEERVIIREEDRLRHIKHREEMDEEERVRIREEDRLRHIQARVEQEEYEAAQFREQEKERKRLARKLKDTKIKPKDGLRTEEILAGTFIVPLLEDSADATGKMDFVCPHCGAFKFKSESAGSYQNRTSSLPSQQTLNGQRYQCISSQVRQHKTDPMWSQGFSKQN